MITKNDIRIYTTKDCGYCKKAKMLLGRYKAKYQEINIANKEDREEMASISGGIRTVPQIFINDVHIGGFDQLNSLHSKGRLKDLIESK